MTAVFLDPVNFLKPTSTTKFGIWLFVNPLTEEECIEVDATIGDYNDLPIYLEIQQLTSRVTSQIEKLLVGNSNIISVRIDCTLISVEHSRRIFRAICTNSTIKSLYIRNCKIEPCHQILLSLAKRNKTIKHLAFATQNDSDVAYINKLRHVNARMCKEMGLTNTNAKY